MLGSRGAALATAVLAAVVLPLAVPGPAGAATELGITFFANTPNSCTGTPDWEAFQVGRSSSVTSTAPGVGVITSWSFDAAEDQTTKLTLRVFRPTTVVGDYTVVDDAGPLLSVAPSAGASTFPARIAVRAGDVIGIHAQGGDCSTGGTTNDVIRSRSGTATAVGATGSYLATTHETLDISAVFEADADGDGYGDETQDGCPGSALTQAACLAPNTRITQHPKHAVFRVRIKFASSVPGSTFRCTLDRRKSRACTSPLVYACPQPGVHHLKVLATSPYGPVEAKPAKVTFRVAKGRTKDC
jgi:hypothetical protein